MKRWQRFKRWLRGWMQPAPALGVMGLLTLWADHWVAAAIFIVASYAVQKFDEYMKQRRMEFAVKTSDKAWTRWQDEMNRAIK